MASTKCKYCNQKITGRIDKVFCSLDCKNKHNYLQRRDTRSATKVIDGFLHRNREILATLIGAGTKYTVDKAVLDQTGFKYDYHTSHYTNKEGKVYWIVYDLAWMTFSDQKILIVRKAK
jgi:hypothetical protein